MQNIADAKVKTRRAADGTYEWTHTLAEGEWFPTKAVTPHGARYQGQRFVAAMARFETESRKGSYLDWSHG